MNAKQAQRFLAKAVGPHTYFITREWVRYAMPCAGRVGFETRRTWKVSVFFADPDARPGESPLDACVCFSDARGLQEAVDGALKKRDAYIEERRRLKNEAFAELDADRQRTEIQHGERLPGGELV